MTQNRKYIVGNWKMNGLAADVGEIVAIAAAAAENRAVDVAIAPPVTLLATAKAAAANFALGAQDCHSAPAGAHTGCLSAAMLSEAGAAFAIVGHSERRSDNHETSAEIKDKAAALLAAAMGAIVCVGEHESERDAGQALAVVGQQLRESLPENADPALLTIAYEPVWAIGTGRVPNSSDIAEMHLEIRNLLLDLIGDSAIAMRILYGGSVNGENAREILAIPNVDGALVGGASLTAAKFAPIIRAAAMQ